MTRLAAAAPAALIAALIGLSAAPAFADDPSAVLARYRAWRGGEAFERLSAVRAEGTIAASGLSGAITLIAEADGDLRRDVDLGVIRNGSARRDSGGWTLTPAGQIEPLAPTDGEDLRRDALLMFEGVLDDPSRLDRRPDAERDGRAFAVVAVDFGDADVHELYIDAGSGALYGLREVRNRRESFVRFDDWREVSGVRMPFRETTTEEVGPPTDVRWSAIEANPVVPADAFDPPTPPASHRFAGDAVSTGFMPFELMGGTRLYLPARVNGQPTEVLLDSGAEMTVLDAAYAASIGLRPGGAAAAVGTGGVGQAQFVSGVTVELDGLTFPDRTVAVIDLSAISQALGRPLPVILGKDAFNGLVVDIDFPGRRIAFHEPAGFVPPADAVEIQLTSSGALRAAPISIEGRPARLFDLDTGNGGALLLYPAYAEAEGLPGDRPKSTALSGAVGGLREAEIATLASIEIGGFEVRNVPTVFTPAGPSAVDVNRTVGNVGMGVLSRFRMITDFGGGRMWLSATPESLARPFARDRLGVSLRKDPDVAVVQRVSPHSPAAEAGLQAGARIAAINGVAIAEMTPADLGAVISGPAGRTVDLRLEDGSSIVLSARDFY